MLRISLPAAPPCPGGSTALKPLAQAQAQGASGKGLTELWEIKQRAEKGKSGNSLEHFLLWGCSELSRTVTRQEFAPLTFSSHTQESPHGNKNLNT